MREKLNPRLLDVIACPRCLARLKYDQENQRLICPLSKWRILLNTVCRFCWQKSRNIKRIRNTYVIYSYYPCSFCIEPLTRKPLADIAGKPMINMFLRKLNNQARAESLLPQITKKLKRPQKLLGLKFA